MGQYQLAGNLEPSLGQCWVGWVRAQHFRKRPTEATVGRECIGIPILKPCYWQYQAMESVGALLRCAKVLIKRGLLSRDDAGCDRRQNKGVAR